MDIKALPDEDLAIYTKSDKEAYREIIKRYELPLVRFAKFVGLNEIKAQQVVQNAFIESYKNLEDFNPKVSFDTWIYEITHKQILATFKEHKHSPLGVYENLEEEFELESNIEEEFEDKKFLEKTLKHLKSLPFFYREPMALHFICRKSYAKISDILKLPVTIVEERIAQGKKLIEEK